MSNLKRSTRKMIITARKRKRHDYSPSERSEIAKRIQATRSEGAEGKRKARYLQIHASKIYSRGKAYEYTKRK